MWNVWFNLPLADLFENSRREMVVRALKSVWKDAQLLKSCCWSNNGLSKCCVNDES